MVCRKPSGGLTSYGYFGEGHLVLKRVLTLLLLSFVHLARIAGPLYTLGGLTGTVCGLVVFGGFEVFEVCACCGLICGAMHVHVRTCTCIWRSREP